MRRALYLALAACGGGGGGGGAGGVDEVLARDVSAQLGVPVTVHCPMTAFPKTCAVRVAGGDDLALAVAEEADGYAWELQGFVIATAPLAEAIGAELHDLGVEGVVDCGPALRGVAVGDRVRCELTLGGVPGAAWARILDDDAGYELELALSPGAAAARSQDGDETALLRASRALDRDDAEGNAVDDDDAPTDGGVALDSSR